LRETLHPKANKEKVRVDLFSGMQVGKNFSNKQKTKFSVFHVPRRCISFSDKGKEKNNILAAQFIKAVMEVLDV
jgi:hypothetical protein